MATPTTRHKLLPYLFYEDVAAALTWLANAFGFSERFRLTFPNGVVGHAELELGDGVVMVGNVGARNRQRPTTVRSSVYVHLRDVSIEDLSRLLRR